MYRGTTPELKIGIDFDPKEIEVLYITFEQKDKIVLEKTLKDCDIQGETIVCKLTQEDTLKFNPTNEKSGAKNWLYIQVRARLKGNETPTTDIKRYEVERILKDGVI